MRRGDERFSDTMARSLEAAVSDRRCGFVRYDGEDWRGLSMNREEMQVEHAEGFWLPHFDLVVTLGFELDERGNVVTLPNDADERRRRNRSEGAIRGTA